MNIGLDIKITNYFQDSLAAKLKIDFKNETFESVNKQDFINGKIDVEVSKKFFETKKNKPNLLNIIIVAKTIKTEFIAQEKRSSDTDDLTGIFYVPATLDENGNLHPPEGKYPWIPREHLYPILEEELAIGHLSDFDDFLSHNFHKLTNDVSWTTYFHFAKDMYEQVTKSSIMDLIVGNINLNKNIFIFEDKTVNANRSILSLYDHLLNSNLDNVPLFKNFINTKFSPQKELIQNSSYEMMNHVAQMGGEYPLSPSQRECVNHFNHMKNGDILAVNGPPGTGKTTLLQSIVANLYVEKALKKEKAPLIVASSTNNQAVTNIIESFGEIKRQWKEHNLEKRWITGVDSFAVYFPSKSKEKEALSKNFHYTNAKGENFFTNVESEENLQSSYENMINECSEFFQTKFTTVQQCKNAIHDQLLHLNQVQKMFIELYKEYEELCIEPISMDTFLSQIESDQEDIVNQIEYNQSRVSEWDMIFMKTPFLFRLLPFLPASKRHVKSLIKLHLNHDEMPLNDAMTREDILDYYGNYSQKLREEMHEKKLLFEKITNIKTTYRGLLNQITYYYTHNKEVEEIHSLDKINKFLDTTIRYSSFWLSVHYFECKWILEKRLTEKQQGKNFENILNQFHNNLSMITPCYVMTFFQLPKLLLAYNGSNDYYLYNEIDLLIVDEAGQVSPEIAACSFALAKRAIVVGDVYQIEPVWNISPGLDLSLAHSSGLITKKSEFDNLRKNGLNTSQSSVMKVAAKSCYYEKNKERGLFLSEHRRCYDEIIDYCNKLVYRGNLEPSRGSGDLDEKNSLRALSIPYIGHYQITSKKSKKSSGSRINHYEATELANWIEENFDLIKMAYPNENPNNLLGIITPFKMQVSKIKKALPLSVRENISVGTVHTFQGGERKIILMSTVYGRDDGCYFIDSNASLLNVAVSRAKDSFLTFGDLECLSENQDTPSGLLKTVIKNNQVPTAVLPPR
ncbi:AAA domain-containing protein [Pseudalkalibacillus sp. JSM 102089]|uniref:AAA domain-containing protein n=1 Tax=Pseudalkalibacillus sp. JSM 102089 TaxID=3229856 RepID=UPI003526AB50